MELGPDSVAECIERAGVGFMFAAHFHPAMKAVVPVRKVGSPLPFCLLCFTVRLAAQERMTQTEGKGGNGSPRSACCGVVGWGRDGSGGARGAQED